LSTEKAAEAGDSVYKLAIKPNLSNEEAIQLSKTLKIADIYTKPFISTIVRLDRTIETAGKNGNLTTEYLSKFGIELTDSKGHNWY